jgi:enediyne biosynthesis protein E4
MPAAVSTRSRLPIRDGQPAHTSTPLQPRKLPRAHCTRPRLTLAHGVFVLAACVVLNSCAPAPRETEAASQPDHTLPSVPAGQAALFADVTDAAGITFVHRVFTDDVPNIMVSDGAGGVVFDYDGDGWMDVYFVNSGPDPDITPGITAADRSPNGLYRNRGDGTFEDVTEPAGVAGHGFGTTAAAADYDNDGHVDLLVVNFGRGILYRNRGDGTFEDVTEPAGITNARAAISATFVDIDRDGHLDLFIANYLIFDPRIEVPPGSPSPYPGPLSYDPEFNVLYRNRGDGTFEDVSESSGIRIPGHRAMSITAFDFDLDGDADLYVSNDATSNLLLMNDGLGRFKDVGLLRGVGVNPFGEAAGSMGASVGDVDGDGWPDLLVTRFGHASLYINSPAGFFEDRIGPSGILEVSHKHVGWGGTFIDLDNDGDLDVVIVNGDPHSLAGMPPLLLENLGDARFRDISHTGGPFFQKRVNARGCGVIDFNNDGAPDLIITTLGGPPILLKNQNTPNHHWLGLRLIGSQSNRDGLGALVRVTAGPLTQSAEMRCPTTYVFQQDPRLHFGLGTQHTIDQIEIRWPSGQKQLLTRIPANQYLTVHEPGPSRWLPQP